MIGKGSSEGPIEHEDVQQGFVLRSQANRPDRLSPIGTLYKSAHDKALKKKPTLSQLLKPILNAQEVAVLLECSVKSVQDYARSGRLPGVKFGDGWVFSSDLLVETVKKLSIEEAEKRTRPVRPIGVPVRTPKRKPPGMGHLSHEEIDHILSGKAKPDHR